MWTCNECGQSFYGPAFIRHQAEKHGTSLSRDLQPRHVVKNLRAKVRRVKKEQNDNEMAIC